MRKMHFKEPMTVYFYVVCLEDVVDREVVWVDDEGFLYDKDDEKVCHMTSIFKNEKDARAYTENVIFPRMRKAEKKSLKIPNIRLGGLMPG